MLLQPLRTCLYFLVFTLLVLGCKDTFVSSSPTNYTIERSYWEACETGEGPCESLSFYRANLSDSIRLILPCGGSFTTVELKEKQSTRLVKSQSFTLETCPPVLDISNLKEGAYILEMYACGLGGPIEFSILTK